LSISQSGKTEATQLVPARPSRARASRAAAATADYSNVPQEVGGACAGAGTPMRDLQLSYDIDVLPPFAERRAIVSRRQ
jgi:hypothetical protein